MSAELDAETSKEAKNSGCTGTALEKLEGTSSIMRFHDHGHPKTATPRPWPHADNAATTAVTEPSTCRPAADEVEEEPPVVVVAFMHIGTCDQATSSIVLLFESA